jgi:hypothetical protein
MEKLVGLRKRADDGTSDSGSDFPVIHKQDTKEQYIYNAKGEGSTKSEEELEKHYDANHARVLDKIQIGNDLPFLINFKYNGKDNWYQFKTNSSISGVDVTEPFFVKFTDPLKQENVEVKIEDEILARVAEKGIVGENLSRLSGELAKFKVKNVPKSDGGAGSPRRSGGSKSPQATSGEILIDEAHRGLTGLADANSKDYVYNTAPDGTWADYSYKGGELKRLTKEYPNWAKFVAGLNTYPTTGATKTAPAATTPTTTPTGAEAAKAPVPEGEAAGVQTRRVVSDAMVMNVAKVLTDVYGGATYAGRTVFRNEMGMVRKMMDQLNSTAQSLGVTIGSAEALAQIITPSIRPGLGRFGTANLDGLGERDMEKQYRAELNLIMTAVKNLFDRIKKSPAQLLNYQPNLRDAAIALKQKREGAKTPAAGTTPAATPAPSAPATPAPSASATPAPATEGTPAPKAEANDGSSFGKKSSLNSKFKKLAKLRRLRVRGQMEAATEPSARLGVSRIS